jgi:menaquinone-dependent protoporphyrinogen oxidase
MKTIILYTTRYGCTEKAAHLLKSKLEGEVDIVNLMKEKAPDLTPYDSVIFGGSIYIGRIQKEMTAYLNEVKSQLGSKRVGLFICAGMKKQIAEELRAAFPEDLLSRACAVEAFGEEIDYKKLSLMDKFITRMVKGKDKPSEGLSEETIERFAHEMTNPLF